MPRQQAFDHAPASVRAARAFVAETLTRWEQVDRLDDVQLCVSELSTNAVVHGEAHADGFMIRLTVADQVMRLEVHSRGTRRPEQQVPVADSITGRGLALVAELSDGWGVEQATGVQIVWTEFKTGTAEVPPTKERKSG